ncbi:MAG: hypothetical protein H0T60_13510, partial [Acidobacteria bacterium]|nr:hypothetical protein [Acidobacteriota bacterium]
LTKAGARHAIVSGSGSSVFGVFDKEREASRARGMLVAEDGWQVFACATLSRGEYRQAFGQCAVIL